MANTHMAFGFLAGMLFFPVLHHSWFIFVPLCILGSLIPDVDHENSKINKLFPLTKWVPKFFKHRGIFHTIFPVILIYLLFKSANADIIGFPLAIGYLSHLVSDSLTESGINFLHPVSRFHMAGFVKTNTIMEFIVFGVVLSLSFLLVFKKFF